MIIDRFLKQFNPRFLLVRIVVNALALAVTAAITPKIYFVDKSFLNWLLMAIMLGVLNALLKPVLQFLTLQFLFVTYGLVIVLVNTLILLLLSFLFPARFAVDNLWWALVGGLVLGLISSFLESLLGLTMPIVPDEPPELRQQVEEEARQVDWLAAARHEAAQEEQALAIEPPAAEAEATGPVMAESGRVEDVVAQAPTAEEATAKDIVSGITATQPIAAEPAPPAANEESSLPEAVKAEPAGTAAPVDAEPAPEPGAEEKQEDRS
jgi:putative membrane protein